MEPSTHNTPDRETQQPQPAPGSTSGRKVLLGLVGVALLLQIALVVFLVDVRSRKAPEPTALPPAATRPAQP